MDESPQPDDAKEIILPPGAEEARTERPTVTERSKERDREDRQFVPVIIKRTDEATRHPDDTLESAIEEGLEQLKRPVMSLILSSIAAGLIVGFSAMAVGVATTAALPYDIPLLTRLVQALVYPFGFVICVMSGAQLYTEHTATAVYPVLDRKAPPKDLLRLWLTVIVGNLIGALIIGYLLARVDVVVGAKAGYIAIGHHLTEYDALTLVISALLAGWLMALGAWLVMATPSGASAIHSIYIVTFLIGIGGLHHSIAGSAEMFTALLIGEKFTFAQSARFIGLALLGNLIGGGVFVGVLNYAHIRQTQTAEK